MLLCTVLLCGVVLLCGLSYSDLPNTYSSILVYYCLVVRIVVCVLLCAAYCCVLRIAVCCVLLCAAYCCVLCFGVCVFLCFVLLCSIVVRARCRFRHRKLLSHIYSDLLNIHPNDLVWHCCVCWYLSCDIVVCVRICCVRSRVIVCVIVVRVMGWLRWAGSFKL